MKVVNNSNWNTDDLKKLINAVLKFSGQDAPRILTIKTGKHNHGTNGRASIGGSWVDMWVPKTMISKKGVGLDGKFHTLCDEEIRFPVEEFSKVFIHEVGHNEGLRHKDMLPWEHIKIPTSIREMVIRSKPKPKPKIKRNLREVRYEHALKMLKKNQTKLKRTKTQINKWAKKVKYYEKTM